VVEKNRDATFLPLPIFVFVKNDLGRETVSWVDVTPIGMWAHNNAYALSTSHHIWCNTQEDKSVRDMRTLHCEVTYQQHDIHICAAWLLSQSRCMSRHMSCRSLCSRSILHHCSTCIE
jgi:hypothetical protein